MWTDYGDRYGEIGFDLEDDEFQYSFSIYGSSRWESGDYVLFVGDDCSGNRDCYLFKKENKNRVDKY